MEKTLTHTHQQDVKFSEVDSLKVVWHGHYVRYFEDGREAFGRAFGIDYLAFNKNNMVTPIVNVTCNYKQFLRYGDTVIIETTFIASDAAKMVFNYRLLNASTRQVVVAGSTVQVFLDSDSFEMQLTDPPFFLLWKQKHGLV